MSIYSGKWASSRWPCKCLFVSNLQKFFLQIYRDISKICTNILNTNYVEGRKLILILFELRAFVRRQQFAVTYLKKVMRWKSMFLRETCKMHCRHKVVSCWRFHRVLVTLETLTTQCLLTTAILWHMDGTCSQLSTLTWQKAPITLHTPNSTRRVRTISSFRFPLLQLCTLCLAQASKPSFNAVQCKICSYSNSIIVGFLLSIDL